MKAALKTYFFIFLLVFLPRLGLLGFILHNNHWDTSLLFWEDSSRYLKSAEYIALKHHYPDYTYDFWPTSAITAEGWDVPLYPAFLSVFFMAFGSGVMLPIFLNIFLFFFAACILCKIGIEAFNQRIAFIASAVFSIYPSLWGHTTFPLAESLFLVLFLSGAYLFMLFLKSTRLRHLIISSIFAALATLTKEVAGFLPLLMSLFIFLKFRKDLKRAITFALLLTAVHILLLAPWCMRNYSAYGHIMLSPKSYEYAKFLQRKIPMLRNHNRRIPPEPFFITYIKEKKHLIFGVGTLSIMKASGFNVAKAKSIVAKNKFAEFLQLLKGLGWGWLVFHFLAWIFMGLVYITSLLSLIYIFIKKRFAQGLAFISVIAYFTLACAFNSGSRYSAPIVPFLALLSGFFLVNLGQFRLKGETDEPR